MEQAAHLKNLFPVVVDGQLSYIDCKGDAILSTEFTRGRLFVEGYAAVYDENGWGLIDQSGQLILAQEFQQIGGFGGGLMSAKWKGKWGYFEVGDWASPKLDFLFADCRSFSCGLAPVTKSKLGRVSYIDKSGRVVIADAGIPVPLLCGNGLAVSANKKGNYGFRSVEDGEWAIKPQFSMARPFAEGLAAINYRADDGDERTGFIDSTGRMVLEPQYHATDARFSDGRAVLSQLDGGVWLHGAIDRDGQVRVPFAYRGLQHFSEGVAAAQRTDSVRWGFIDVDGAEVIAPRFDRSAVFANGLAWVQERNRSGYINRGGEYVYELE